MKKIVIYLIPFLLMVNSLKVIAQVGVGTTTPDPSSVLDITATDKGILIPRVSLNDVSNTMIDGTNTASTGLLIWNTNAATIAGNGIGFYFFNGSLWEKLATGNSEDHDWYEQGTTNPPNAITDNIFTQGSVAINTTASPGIQLNVSAASSASYAGYFTNFSTGGSVKYGLKTDVTSNTNFAKYGVHNTLGSIDNSGTLYGIYNYVFGANNELRYGVYNNITGDGNGIHRGIYNNLTGIGTGQKMGIHNEINTTATSGNIYGVNNEITNSGSGIKTGVRNILTGSNTVLTGTYSILDNGGNGNNYGITSVLTGNATGLNICVNNLITNSGGSIHYGIQQNFSGDSDTSIGTINRFDGTSTIYMKGTYNWFQTLSADHTGFENYFNIGSGTQIGLYNNFSSQNGTQTGTYSTFQSISTASQYGNRVEYTAASSGITNKYGFYVTANTATAGNIYGVYADIPQSTGQAAYLDGNVTINESGAARNVRIETDTKTHALYTDGTNNVVRFGSLTGSLAGNGTTVNGTVLNYAADFDNNVNGTTIGVGTSEYIADVGNFFLAFNGAVIPAFDNLDDLGSATQRWDDVYATSGVVNTSDIKLKKNIKTLPYGLSEVLKMQPISYQWKNSQLNETKLGFSAQDLLKIIPEVVKIEDVVYSENDRSSTVKTNENLGVYYSDIIPVLTKAIQEQQVMIEDLLKRIEVLEKK
jgi:ribosomal protein L31